MVSTIINWVRKYDQRSDFLFWQTQGYEKRLATLETIRQEYISWKYAYKPGFQRVITIVKRK